MVRLSMGVSDMKKFLINIAIFFAIVAAVDFSLGWVFHYLRSTAGGRTGAEYYACKRSNEDVIIMGSSRASHHYVPEIISEKTGWSCYNAGQDGNGIILQYGRWKMISERYAPKLIIYDISTSFDMTLNDNMTYVDRLKPFCDDGAVRNYISSLFPIEQVKTLSNLYCNNYKFIELLFDCIRKADYMNNAGYIPLYGRIRKEIVEKENLEKKNTIEIDKIKLFYLEQLVKEAKPNGTDVVFVVSPYWKGGGDALKAYDKIKDITNRYDIPFIEYLNSEICDEADYFKDSYHLNNDGAISFTNVVIEDIKKELH